MRHLRRRRALSADAGAAALAAAAFLALAACGSEGDWQRLEERWVEQAGYHPLERYPPREANSSALRIEELLAPFGFELAPRESEGRPPVGREAAERLKQVDSETIEVLFEGEAVLDGHLPEGLDRWLNEIEPALVEARKLLRSDEPPQWELRLDQGYDARISNLIGHMRLHRVLLLAAVEAAGSGPDESGAWLAAARQLRASLEGDPLLLHQAIAFAETAAIQRVLRRLENVPDNWRDLLPSVKLREAAYEALRLEAWTMIQTARKGRLGGSGEDREVPGFLTYQGARGLTTAIEEAIQRTRAADLRHFDSEAVYSEVAAGIPRWNVIARILFPTLLDAPVKAARAELDLELTRQILELRERLRDGEPVGPNLLASQSSIAAPGIVWERSLEAEAIRIRAVGGEIPTASKYPLSLDVTISTFPPGEPRTSFI